MSWLVSRTLTDLVAPKIVACSCYHKQVHLPRTYNCAQKLITAGCELDDCQFDITTIFARLPWDHICLHVNTSASSRSDDQDTLLSTETDPSFIFKELRDFNDFLRRNGLDLLDVANPEHWVLDILYNYPDTWPVLMAIGLDPNSQSVFGNGDMNTPIIEALYSLSLHRGAHEAKVIIDSLAMLIRQGADIYDVHWADHAWCNAVEDGVMTPTTYARAMDDDLVRLWERALRRAGLNPQDVFAEDTRQRREFLEIQRR